jgi:predicted AlkP superfamily pyrophosphatase or phosphodiesterase
MKKLLLLLLVLIASELFAQVKSAPYVILVSFDGFRHDYVEKYNAPTFKSMYKNGAHAEAMVPSFPSKTFPNHYTLVTGLYPGHHGLVDNTFYDKARNATYGMRDSEKVSDPYYYGGVPLWELARQQGMKSASYFWVGSEMSVEARQPNYFYKFDDTMPPSARIDQAFTWLKLPENERPHMITLYFSFPDHEGHDSGPESADTKGAVLRADSLLNKLLKGLEGIDLPVNVIVVSDHGMKELTVARETYIVLPELINMKNPGVKVANGGTQAHLYVSDVVKRDSLYNLLKSKEKNFKVYRKEDFLLGWNYKNDRVGDLLIAATPGYYISSATSLSPTMVMGSKFGVHGYDPMVVTDMRGIFFAIGPNIKKGKEIAPFQNIHVYPLVAKILGLKIPAIDGKFEVLEEIYRK